MLHTRVAACAGTGFESDIELGLEFANAVIALGEVGRIVSHTLSMHGKPEVGPNTHRFFR